jgi:hypothetical protein
VNYTGSALTTPAIFTNPVLDAVFGQIALVIIVILFYFIVFWGGDRRKQSALTRRDTAGDSLR